MQTVKLDFVIAGAPKAATTSLVDALRKHPGVYLPDQKELRFFDRPDCLSRVAELEPHFADAWEGQLCGEGTPWYMCSSTAAESLSRLYPALKTIFVLREPIARARSHYLHRVARQAEYRSFEQALEEEVRRLEGRGVHQSSREDYLVQPGLYASHLSSWLACFPKEQLQVILFDDLIRAPEATLDSIQKHLGLDACDLALPASNRTPGLRAPWLGRLAAKLMRSDNRAKRTVQRLTPQAWRSWTRRTLSAANRSPQSPPSLTIQEPHWSMMQEYFGPEIERLEAMLGRALPSWKTEGRKGATAPSHPHAER